MNKNKDCSQVSTSSSSIISVDDVNYAITNERSRQELIIPDGSSSSRRRNNQMKKCMLLSVAYSANLGGTATIIGSSTNLVLIGVVDE